MSRKRSVTLRCSWPEGCDERAFYEVDTLREDRELRAKPWLCLRHTRPTEVLTPDNHGWAMLVVAEETYGRFWRKPGAESGGTGFAHGPGFKAWAKDFPPGTTLVVTARVELPASDSVSSSDASSAGSAEGER